MRAAISVRRIRQKRQATGRNSTVKNDDRGRAGEFGVFEAEFNLLLRNSMEPEGAASVKEEPPVQERTKKLGSEESLPQLVWLLQPQTRHKAAWDIFISVMIVYSASPAHFWQLRLWQIQIDLRKSFDSGAS
ncbi:unnamed protein product [Effrenium voratum]|nr:unnamed protein product [Effrenium voratum]CAJ1427090.1 unnamed protein product [Effrenium voratum]